MGLNGGIGFAISNDERLVERQKLDSAQIRHRDPICLPRSSEEVVIRNLLSDPLTSQMDEAIMGATGGKPFLEHNAFVVRRLLDWPTMPFLQLDELTALSSWSSIYSVYYCSLNF